MIECNYDDVLMEVMDGNDKGKRTSARSGATNLNSPRARLSKPEPPDSQSPSQE